MAAFAFIRFTTEPAGQGSATLLAYAAAGSRIVTLAASDGSGTG
jgi:hypothetical protein